ncbi:MAG: fumarylacetoacetate hydrolase family protein [Myxococcales bacterium]|nr:fumarylacetoacetate hydrolase family protein [Myxococcales bacterium]
MRIQGAPSYALIEGGWLLPLDAPPWADGRPSWAASRSKSFDTFACAGPWVEAELSYDDLQLVCRVNGEVRQIGRTSEMVFSPACLLSFISQVMTLLPGDLVATGTPPGVGALRAGDRVEVEIEGIGALHNPVESAAP